jgi:hypothetical protein
MGVDGRVGPVAKALSELVAEALREPVAVAEVESLQRVAESWAL